MADMFRKWIPKGKELYYRKKYEKEFEGIVMMDDYETLHKVGNKKQLGTWFDIGYTKKRRKK